MTGIKLVLLGHIMNKIFVNTPFFRFLLARLKEPSTYLGIAWMVKTIQEAPHVMTVDTLEQVAAASCAIIMKSPGNEWIKPMDK